MIKKILPCLLSFAIILSAFASLPFSAAESTGNLKPATIADSYSADGWYRTYPSGGKADNAAHYIEIAADGADDVGSLHFVNTTPESDMRINIAKTIPAGDYTLKFKIKGSRTYSDQNFSFAEYEYRDTPVQLMDGIKSYDEWTEVTLPFTSRGGSNFLFIFSMYNWQTSIYIDNFKVLDASGNDMLDGAGNFCTEDTGEETSKMQQPYEYVSSDYWYRTYPSGSTADNTTHYIEIAADGAGDVGSLHFINTTPESDMRINIAKTIPAGDYTLKFKIKGSRTYSDQNLSFAEYEYRDTPVQLMDGIKSYDEWTEVTLPFTSRGGSNFLFIFSKYNWQTSITKVAQSSFKTADIGPRVMTVGGVTNVRDLGGYETSFGKTTLQGLAFRGAQLDIKGVSRLTAQGAELLGTDIALGLEIDLRTASETGGLTKSVVPTAAYLNSRIGSYTAAFSSSQKELFRQIFASYADVNNYPIYVHCVYGADRTGTVCYILNALLGVDEKTLIQDYEFTTFSDAGLRSAATNAEMKAFLTSFNALSGSTPAEKAENYLLSIGVTNEEISTIRGIFFGEIPLN